MDPSLRAPGGILATCVVPWDDDLRFAEDQFRQQVALLANELTRHLYIFGTGGEGYAVTDRQFRTVAEAFADEATEHGVTPMLGVISLSLGTIVERIELGLGLGYEEFQISFPSWGPLSDREVDDFFARTCGAYPQARFLHYNNPRTKRVLQGREYGRLADLHSNLVAVKFSSSEPAVVEELVSGAAPLRCFLTEFAYALARDRHACGLLVSLAHVRFTLAEEYHAARGGRLAELAQEIHRIDDVVCAAVADPDIHMDGVYDKLIAKLHAPNLPLRLLPPYRGAADTDFARLRVGLAGILTAAPISRRSPDASG